MDDKRLERIERKLDDSNDHLASIDVTLAMQHESLRDHIRRTTLLEQELRPIKKHVDMVSGVLKFIVIIGVILGIVAAIQSLTK